MENEEQNLSLNEIDNAIDSLKVAKEFIEKDENFKWKWVTIALHHSLYSFCISALVNGNYDNVLSFYKNEDSDGWLSRNDKWKKLCKKRYEDRPYYRMVWFDTDEKPPERKPTEKKKHEEKLIGFWTALARVMDGEDWMGKSVNTKQLKLRDDELEKIYWVSKFVRNDLIHFIPKNKSLNIKNLKESLLIIINAIEFLIKDSNSITGISLEAHSDINNCIGIIKEHLK